MLTAKYQEKYTEYAQYVRFWDRVDIAGIRSSGLLRGLPNGQSLQMYVYYVRTVDGSVANERVEVDVVVDPTTGLLLIDDYRYVGVG